VVALLGCWFALAACLLDVLGDKAASLIVDRSKSSVKEKGSCSVGKCAPSSAPAVTTASASSALLDSTAPETAVPVDSPGSQLEYDSGSQSECITFVLRRSCVPRWSCFAVTVSGLRIIGPWCYRVVPVLQLIEFCLALGALSLLLIGYLLLPKATLQQWLSCMIIHGRSALDKLHPSESIIQRYDKRFGLEVWSRFFEAHPSVLSWAY